MRDAKTDWRNYLREGEIEKVREVERVAAHHDAKKKEAMLSIHYIRNAAMQRRRYAVGNITEGAK